MGRILAIDFGLKRTGLAVTDPGQRIATALTTVATHTLIGFLTKYIGENEVDKIVVGEPRHMNNTASGPVKDINLLLKKLQAGFNIPVFRMDERFTSLIAARSLIESGVKKSDRRNKALVDQVSAVLILQSFMEQQQHGGNEY